SPTLGQRIYRPTDVGRRASLWPASRRASIVATREGYSGVRDRRRSPMSNGPLHAEPPTRALTGVQILGTGRYVPDRVVTNHDLWETLGFDPDWIVNRTGILERRFA